MKIIQNIIALFLIHIIGYIFLGLFTYKRFGKDGILVVCIIFIGHLIGITIWLKHIQFNKKVINLHNDSY